MKKLIKTLLFIAWLIVIYCLSGQSGVASSGLSRKLLTIIGETINYIHPIDVLKFVDDFSIVFRKFAHFFEYFILFILTYECFKEYGNKRLILITILFCITYACFDEFHQLFIDGRSGQISDVLIDSSGACLSCVIWHLLIKK